MTRKSYLSKLSLVDLNNISLYLKYGIISFKFKDKKRQKRKIKKIKNINYKEFLHRCIKLLVEVNR